MISWAGREPLTISDFSSLTCDQAVLRFSYFLWEALSQVISIFATSNVNKNRFHCLIECHINTIIYKQKGTTLYISSPTNWERRREVSRHRISQFCVLVDIYSILCVLSVRVRVENYGKSSMNLYRRRNVQS